MFLIKKYGLSQALRTWTRRTVIFLLPWLQAPPEQCLTRDKFDEGLMTSHSKEDRHIQFSWNQHNEVMKDALQILRSEAAMFAKQMETALAGLH